MPGAYAPGQVLPIEARSGQSAKTGLEPVEIDELRSQGTGL